MTTRYMERLRDHVEEQLWRQGTPAEIAPNLFRGYDWSNVFLVVRVLQPHEVPDEADEVHVIVMNALDLVAATAGFRHCSPERVAVFLSSHFR